MGAMLGGCEGKGGEGGDMAGLGAAGSARLCPPRRSVAKHGPGPPPGGVERQNEAVREPCLGAWWEGVPEQWVSNELNTSEAAPGSSCWLSSPRE